MKQYMIDELRPGEYEKLKAELDRRFGPAKLGGVYWVFPDPDLYTPFQMSHSGCQPFYMAMELTEDYLACEFLMRSSKIMRCACVAYATMEQRIWAMELIDGLFDSLGVIT